MKFRRLRENEIDVKVGSVTSKGYTLLLYKNARVDMAVLDETVGAENWQNKFYEVVGNLYCSLGIKCGNEWIWKDDCGVESDFGDKEKGQASDARKRAGFAWGIGRELYTSPFIFIPCETIKEGNSYKIANYEDKKRSGLMKVAKIVYDNDGCITDLIIVDNNGEIAFKTGKQEENKPKQTGSAKTGQSAEFRFEKGKYAGLTIADIYTKDKGYLDYCLNNSNVSSTIKEKIKEYYDSI